MSQKGKNVLIASHSDQSSFELSLIDQLIVKFESFSWLETGNAYGYMTVFLLFHTLKQFHTVSLSMAYSIKHRWSIENY